MKLKYFWNVFFVVFVLFMVFYNKDLFVFTSNTGIDDLPIFIKSYFLAFFISLFPLFFYNKNILNERDGKLFLSPVTLKFLFFQIFFISLINSFAFCLIEKFLGIGFFYCFFLFLNFLSYFSQLFFWEYFHYLFISIPVERIINGLETISNICFNLKFKKFYHFRIPLLNHTFLSPFEIIHDNSVWYFINSVEKTKVPLPKSFYNYLDESSFTGEVGMIFRYSLNTKVQESIDKLTKSFSFTDYKEIVLLVKFFNDYFHFFDELGEYYLSDGFFTEGESQITRDFLKENYLSYLSSPVPPTHVEI